ncbi:MAG: helix-turn-helix domain-containing protein [Planctomycetota bacterium]
MANNAFFKFFQDIVLSGVWEKLTPSARALYPVLAIHTDRNFKPVFPSLRRLKELSGLGNNGIASAIRSLEENGLVRVWSGKHKTGNVPNTYEFIFEYPGSQISLPPQRGKATPTTRAGHAPPRGKASPNRGQSLPPRDDTLSPQRGTNKRSKRTRKKSATTEPTTHIEGGVHINITHDASGAVVDALKQFFSPRVAKRLASEYPADYIQEKIEITRFNHERGKVRDPAAFLRQALNKDFGRPAGFTTTAERQQTAQREKQVERLKERILKREVTVARHRESGEASLVDVPADLSYIILQGRHGSRCINTWDDVQQYSFE